MTPDVLIQRAREAGVNLWVTPENTIRVSGNREALRELLPLIREYKAMLINILGVPQKVYEEIKRTIPAELAQAMDLVAEVFPGATLVRFEKDE